MEQIKIADTTGSLTLFVDIIYPEDKALEMMNNYLAQRPYLSLNKQKAEEQDVVKSVNYWFVYFKKVSRKQELDKQKTLICNTCKELSLAIDTIEHHEVGKKASLGINWTLVLQDGCGYTYCATDSEVEKMISKIKKDHRIEGELK